MLRLNLLSQWKQLNKGVICKEAGGLLDGLF